MVRFLHIVMKSHKMRIINLQRIKEENLYQMISSPNLVTRYLIQGHLCLLKLMSLKDTCSNTRRQRKLSNRSKQKNRTRLRIRYRNYRKWLHNSKISSNHCQRSKMENIFRVLILHILKILVSQSQRNLKKRQKMQNLNNTNPLIIKNLIILFTNQWQTMRVNSMLSSTKRMQKMHR